MPRRKLYKAVISVLVFVGKCTSCTRGKIKFQSATTWLYCTELLVSPYYLRTFYTRELYSLILDMPNKVPLTSLMQ